MHRDEWDDEDAEPGKNEHLKIELFCQRIAIPIIPIFT